MDYANQIAQLNGQIKLAEQAGQKPSAMLDRRDLLLDKLSSLAQVKVTQQPDGTDTVSFGNAAKPLVEGTTVNWPQALTSAAGGQLGTLLGLTEPGGALAGYQTTLDAVASSLADSVNALHTSTPFFTGTTAATICGRSDPRSGPDILDRHARRQRRRDRDRWLCAAAPPTRAGPRWSGRSAGPSRRRKTNRPTFRRSSVRSTASARVSPACRSTKK